MRYVSFCLCMYNYTVYLTVLVCIDVKFCVQYMHSYGMNFSDNINYMYYTCNYFRLKSIHIARLAICFNPLPVIMAGKINNR